ncbi:MAG: hypothetical protein ACFFKA_12885 [Candidatus Thorarchaeota archaeon]
MLTNEELIAFINRYKIQQNEKEFLYYFEQIKKYLKLYKYKDPSGILTTQDFEIIALEGFWKAINKYDESRWDNAISWCFHIVKQQILRELKKTYKKEKTILNSHMMEDLEIESYELEDKEDVKIETYKKYISDVQSLCSVLEVESVKASKAFQLRLAFPSISRTSIAKILGFRRRNGLAKIVRIIRAVSKWEFDKDLTDVSE